MCQEDYTKVEDCEISSSNGRRIPESVFLAKDIACSELQSESKKLFQECTGTYSDILDKINSDHKSQKFGEQMRDGVSTISRTKISRTGISETTQQCVKPTRKNSAPGLTKFPVNKWNFTTHMNYL